MNIPSNRRNNVVFLWNQLHGVPIIQAPVQQRKDSCAITAVSTTIEYNLRISYLAHTRQPMALPSGRLIDQGAWEDLIQQLFQVQVKILPRLLNDAKFNGVPMWNRLKLKIDNHSALNVGDPMAIKSSLTSVTLLAVMKIYDDYEDDGSVPYMGRGSPIWDRLNVVQAMHAVVIVGEYQDDTLFAPHEVPEPLWIYQDSHGNRGTSFLGDGLNVVRHSLLVEAHRADTFAASELLLDHMAIHVEPFHRNRLRAHPEVLT